MPQPEMGSHQIRLLPQDEFIFLDCIFRASDSDLQLTQSQPGQRIHAVKADGLSVGLFGLVIAAGALERLGQRDPG